MPLFQLKTNCRSAGRRATPQFVLLIALPLISLVSACTAQKVTTTFRYSVLRLSEVPRIAENVGMRINAKDEVCFWKEMEDHTLRAAVWRNGTVIALKLPPGYRNALARDISARGVVAGWAVSTQNPVNSQAKTRASFFSGDTAVEIGSLGGRDSQAFGINGKNQIVGSSELSNRSRHAFLYNAGKMIDLGALPKALSSVAYAINEAGTVVGGCDLTPGVERGCIWKDGKLIDIGTLAEGKSSMARAINDKDQIVGYAYAGDDIHAFLYDKGKMTDLGTLGNEPAVANGINNLCEIVGSSKADRKGLHAFLWKNGKMLDLNKLIPADTGLLLREAYSINDAGKIVCLGSDKVGHFYCVLLSPVK